MTVRLPLAGLGVPPAACVVFEDTDIGLLAAHRAGMASVDVRTDW